MSETQKPKRKFWQIHLSTAVLLMIVAGGVLWLNLQRSFMIDPTKDVGLELGGDLLPDSFNGGFIEVPLEQRGWLDRGWPMTAYRIDATFCPAGQAWERYPSPNGDLIISGKGIVTPVQGGKDLPMKLGIAVDIIMVLSVLTVTALLCEYIIRRRESRKPPAPP